MIPSCSQLFLHLKQQPKSQSKLQPVSCFPTFFLILPPPSSEASLAGLFPLSLLRICSHVHVLPPWSPVVSMRLSQSVCVMQKVYLDVFWCLTAKLKMVMEGKSKSYCGNGYLWNPYLHERKWDLFPPNNFSSPLNYFWPAYITPGAALLYTMQMYLFPTMFWQ